MFLFAIAFASIVAIAEIDLIVPSFPEIQRLFQLSAFEVELTLSLNLFAHCLAGLFAGNLGDKFGRRYIILWGFSIFVLGSVLGIFAPNFPLLLLARVLQGAGVAPAIVLGYLIAIDNYPPADQGRIMGLLNGVVAISLSAAPVVGSYVSLFFGFKGNFTLMAISGVFGYLALACFIPQDKQHNTEIGVHLNEYLPVLKNPIAMTHVCWLSLMVAAFYVFVGIASLLLVDGMGLTLAQFGYYMGILTFAFGLFSVFSGKIMQWMGKKLAFNVSLVFLLAFLVGTAALVISASNSPELILLVLLLFVVGAVVPFNEGFVVALDCMPDAKGKISALITAGKWIFTVLGVQTASYFYHGSFAPIGITLFIMMLIGSVQMLMIYRSDPKFSNAFSTSQG